MHVLASAEGKTKHGNLNYLIVWPAFGKNVSLERYLDEPVTDHPDSDNIILSVPIITMAYYAQNMLDPLFPERSIAEGDYDYEVLSKCYRIFLGRFEKVMNIHNWRNINW